MREVCEHNHVNLGVVEAKLAVTQIKQRAENSRDAPRLLIQQAQSTLSDEAFAEVPQYNSLQRTIQRKRKINGQPVANLRTIQEIDVPAKLRRTFRGDDFLLHDSGEDDPE